MTTDSLKVPNPTDLAVGKRIRMRRALLGMSQTVLAKRIGVTFQQVQKYEKGSNRVSASRLQRIADILDVPASFFFERAESEPVVTGLDSNHTLLLDILGTAEGIALVRAYASIKDRKVRSSAVALLQSIAAAADKQT